jgi:hypothetical protein
VCARAAESESRALETDANRLNGRLLGVHRTVRSYSRQARQRTNEPFPEIAHVKHTGTSREPRFRCLCCDSPQQLHGDASTGPRTAEGLARSKRARWNHGLYSTEALAEQKRVRDLLIQSRELLKQMQAG